MTDRHQFGATGSTGGMQYQSNIFRTDLLFHYREPVLISIQKTNFPSRVYADSNVNGLFWNCLFYCVTDRTGSDDCFGMHILQTEDEFFSGIGRV